MQKLKFSKIGQQALMISAAVGEMAVEDGWESLDECMDQSPEMLEKYTKLSEAALRAFERCMDPSAPRPTNLRGQEGLKRLN